MSFAEWLDINSLKLLSQHTSAIAGAVISFWAISKFVRWTAGVGTFANCVEYGEKGILAVLLVWFTYQMFLLLWKGRVRFHNGVQLFSMVA
jgi:hypothetical protein